MSQATLIKRHQTIKVKVTARPSLTHLPKFVPQKLISTDPSNTLTLGQDNKLYVPQNTPNQTNIYIKEDW